MESVIGRLIAVYEEALIQFKEMPPSREAEENAAAAYLSWLSLQVKGTIDRNMAASALLKRAAGAPSRASLKVRLRNFLPRFRR
jgi:hypothetical protein